MAIRSGTFNILSGSAQMRRRGLADERRNKTKGTMGFERFIPGDAANGGFAGVLNPGEIPELVLAGIARINKNDLSGHRRGSRQQTVVCIIEGDLCKHV